MSNIKRIDTKNTKQNIRIVSNQKPINIHVDSTNIESTKINAVSTQHPSNVYTTSKQGSTNNIQIDHQSHGNPDVPDYYTGPTIAIPTTIEQVFNTNNKILMRDFVVKPIPSNYGLVTWNGSVLIIS